MKGVGLLNKEGERRPMAPPIKTAQSSTEERAGFIVSVGSGGEGEKACEEG